LKGIRIIESMRFASPELASNWLKVARKGIRKPTGGSPYKVIDASFQNYSR